MIYKQDQEETIVNNDKKIRELSIRIEALDKEIAALLQELKVTPEQLTAFVQKQENFTENNWKQKQDYRKEWEQKLKRELDNIWNPKKARESWTGTRVDKTWIFCR